MTVSDVERRHAMDPFFTADLRNYADSFDLELPNSPQ